LRKLLLVLALAAAPAFAQQVLYKLIAPDGSVTYTDKVPKNYNGKVIRLESDTDPNVMPAARSAEKSPAAAIIEGKGLADTRRKTRETLEKQLRAAQEKVEAARKARDSGAEPRSDELQTVQRRYAPLASGQAPPRPNCFNSVDPNGVASLVCPQAVPQEAYYERRRKLDEDLRLAEEELAAAEQAYRRGTD
jgi:hypothetical protein